jgi:TonB family protein
MKHPTGYAKPRRLATPRKPVQLQLRQRLAPKPDDELKMGPKSSFWRWVVLVTLFHLVAICLLYWLYETATPPPPPVQFISLLPTGDVVKGEPGIQKAPKVGPTTPAPSVHHSAPPPETAPPTPPVPQVIKPPPTPPEPVVKEDAPPIMPDKPVTPKPVAAKPKVKVDLTLADGPTTDKPVTKPKPHPKKTVAKAAPDDSNAPESASASTPESAGLSKEEIAAKLGEKMKAAGIENATQTGTSGSENTKANSYADFYDAITDQIMDKWTSPDLNYETGMNPVVHIHVEKDGRVTPGSVTLVQSSGNAAYDDSAVAAAKSLGYLYEPLPDGCPPDIRITFKPPAH